MPLSSVAIYAWGKHGKTPANASVGKADFAELLLCKAQSMPEQMQSTFHVYES